MGKVGLFFVLYHKTPIGMVKGFVLYHKTADRIIKGNNFVPQNQTQGYRGIASYVPQNSKETGYHFSPYADTGFWLPEGFCATKGRILYHKTMGRPTDDLKQHTLRVRVSESSYGRLIKEAKERDITLSELVRDALNGKPLSGTAALKEEDSFVPQNEIANMCEWFSLTPEEFYSQIYELFLNGKITVEDGKVVLNEIK